jgi:hypothetical protein
MYFSGYTRDYYDNIKDELDDYQKADPKLFERISLNNIDLNKRMNNEFRELDPGLPKLIQDLTELKFGEALVQVKKAFSSFLKSKDSNPIPSHINKSNKTLNINNTLITIISKKENSAKKILEKLSNQLWKSDNCFSQILGLDMQNSFTEQASFIDKNLLNSSIDTLLYHRQKLIDDGLKFEFESFIKEILHEQAKLTLEDANLKVLDNTFLEKISKKNYKVADKDLARLNAFYNGSYIKNKEKLNFGDIFYHSKTNQYYLCITALCDCLHPENIKNNFFFVIGRTTKVMAEALETGDGNFKSYIASDNCIKWTMPEDDWNKGDYIKPVQLHIPCTDLKNKELVIQFIKDGSHSTETVKYAFTLKDQYAQRIANHTFFHPLRVGVDFVKKN